MRILRPVPICASVVCGVASVAAVAASRADDWTQPGMVVLLLVFAVIADRFEIRTRSGMFVSGSMPPFVLVAVLFGPSPAAAVGALAALSQWRKSWQLKIADLAAYLAFPLIAGLAARVADVPDPVHNWLWFMAMVAATYMLASTVNFGMIAGFMRMLRGRSFSMNFATTWRPLVNSQLVHALGTAGLAYAYLRVGSAVIVFAGALAVTFSRLLRDLLQAERHAETARQLAADAQEQRDGLVRIILDFLDARDQMTARHSAAVARYARRIAEAAGCPEAEQRLVHTAALYHDVGKVMFADRMFKAGKLTDEEWEIVKRHPERGAELVGHLPNHADVAAIILAHHERIDGKGYPRGLVGEEIPRLSRMISIADTYDVMTGRDSYRSPVSSAEAIAELRRVSGAQLDGELVELFVERVLATEDVAFRHGDDADFEAELAAERRAREAWTPDVPAPKPALEAA